MYRAQASQHRQAAQLTNSPGVDTTLLQRPHRTYHPSARPTDQDTSTPKATQTAAPAGELDHLLAAIARHTGATLRIYPRPGRAARRIVLRDDRDDRGNHHLAAALETDGTLRITGHDQGSRR
jgi:hypothetical protein